MIIHSVTLLSRLNKSRAISFLDYCVGRYVTCALKSRVLLLNNVICNVYNILFKLKPFIIFLIFIELFHKTTLHALISWLGLSETFRYFYISIKQRFSQFLLSVRSWEIVGFFVDIITPSDHL